MTLDQGTTTVSDGDRAPSSVCAVLIDGNVNRNGAVWVFSKPELAIELREGGHVVVLLPANVDCAFLYVSSVRYFRRS